jgi:ribosomal protein L34
MQILSNHTPSGKFFTNYDKALYRAKSSLVVGQRLEVAALAEGNADALAIADLLIEAARPENIFIATDLEDKNGKRFSGYGSFNCASTRFDPAYAKKRSNRAYKAVREAMVRGKRQSELQMFITFTMPTLIGFGFKRTFEVFDYAWSLMRKRKWFREHISAACCSEEFTLGDEKKLRIEGRDWDFNRDGFHVHKHVLCYAKRMNTAELRSEWTACLEASAKKFGFRASFNTKDGLAVVQRKSAYGDKALREISKYICKGEVFERIPGSQICEVEKTLRGRRLISTFGLCNENRGSKKKSGSLHLDKKSITDGEKISPVPLSIPKSKPLRIIGRELIMQGKRKEWLYLLQNTFRIRRQWRRKQLLEIFPFATFVTLGGEKFYGDSISSKLDIAHAA